MQKTYDPKDIEQRTYQRWEANGWFMPSGKGQPYCIVIPPPKSVSIAPGATAFTAIPRAPNSLA